MAKPARSLLSLWRASSRASCASLTSWALLAACVSAAIGLRFYAIDHLPGINGDEPQYAVHAHAFFDGAKLSSLRTGSDLPMNPAFFGTVVVLQKLLPQTFWTLRLSAVVLSLATITLAWVLFRQRGAMFAATFACLVAALPIHLGYARFAWDPTAIPTVSVLALAASARGRALWTLAAWLLCLWVHPTTVFLAPCLAAPFLARLGARAALGVLALPLMAAVAYLGLEGDWLPGAVANVLRGDLSAAARARALDPAQLGSFLLAYLELLSGPTIYRYITGSLSRRAGQLHLALSLALVLPLLAAGLCAAARRRRTLDLATALGWLVSVLLLYLLAGPVAVEPKTERYAVCLTVPACYVLSTCIDALATTGVRARWLRIALSLLGGALLVSFCTHYLHRLERPDSAREDAFRSGEIEPKLQALRAVAALRDPAKLPLIYVEDWWIYWPVRYLATSSSELAARVTIFNRPWHHFFPRDFELPRYEPARMERFGVAWAGHRLDASFARFADAQREIYGYGPDPILRVYKLRGLPERKLRRARGR